jgi:aminobenzoyl-glutamate utilization protein B
MFGSTDVVDVSVTCLTAQLSAAIWAAGTPIHSWQAVAHGESELVHKGSLHAAKVLARSAIVVRSRPHIAGVAKNELSRRLGGARFISLTRKSCKPPLQKSLASTGTGNLD